MLRSLVSKQRSTPDAIPLPKEILQWQVALRRWTMETRQGAPHVGVAPIVTVRRPGPALGITSHSIICGLLPAPDLLEQRTAEFRRLYEETIPLGSRATYDRGLDYLSTYYRSADHFDPSSFTTLVSLDSPVALALTAEPRCSLLFHVFDLQAKSEVERTRCLHLDCKADVLREGPVFENVWWHNTLFHGKAEDSAVLHFHHLRTVDTKFGRLEVLS